jgi:hypothetical protein
MASLLVPANSSVTLTVPASSAIATYSLGPYSIDKILTFANYPNATANVFNGSGANTTSAFTVATTVTITAGSKAVWYNVGTGPVVIERDVYQPTPGTLNATGTLTAALLLGGIVTSTSAAAVAATLDTGALCDAALTIGIDEAFDWAVINTGPNTVTVTASSGHTIVGVAAVATVTSARFRTRKTAANTFVTYRLA